MRIKENSCVENAAYPSALRRQVAEIFQYACYVAEIKSLLAEIKKEASSLTLLFLTEEEEKVKAEAVSYFDARMQANVYYTLRNIKSYLHREWRNLINEKGNGDKRVNIIPKQK